MNFGGQQGIDRPVFHVLTHHALVGAPGKQGHIAVEAQHRAVEISRRFLGAQHGVSRALLLLLPGVVVFVPQVCHDLFAQHADDDGHVLGLHKADAVQYVLDERLVPHPAQGLWDIGLLAL